MLDVPGNFRLSSHLFVICFFVFLVLPFSDGDDIVNAPHDVEILRCWVQSARARVSSQAKYEEKEEEAISLKKIKKKKKKKEIKGKFTDLSTERSKKIKFLGIGPFLKYSCFLLEETQIHKVGEKNKI